MVGGINNLKGVTTMELIAEFERGNNNGVNFRG